MKVYVVISSFKMDGYVFDELEFICADYKRAKEICDSMSKDKSMYYKVRIEEHEIIESEVTTN